MPERNQQIIYIIMSKKPIIVYAITDSRLEDYYEGNNKDQIKQIRVASMDLTKVLSVSCQDYDKKFEQTLKKYAVA